jgi:PAT family acetyl-CoA transporter-like MFS transporter 1
LGGTWPRWFVLEAVDMLTVTQCTLPDADGTFKSCNTDKMKAMCTALKRNFTDSHGNVTEVHGKCDTLNDGYYLVGMVSFVLGLIALWMFVKDEVQHLERVPERQWRISKEKVEDKEAEQVLLATGISTRKSDGELENIKSH